MKRIGTQEDWFNRAKAVLPAGGFGNFDHHMIMQKGKGSHIWDEDGNEYIDYLIGSGPMLLGHGHPEVLEVVFEQISKGMTFFANNAAGIELAEEIIKAVPCAEFVRYVTSGGEADMYAIRLARAYTGKEKILKFEGGYHGMSAEAQMSLAPSRLQNFPMAVPDSAGIPNSVRDEMVISQFNDFEITQSLLDEYDKDLSYYENLLEKYISKKMICTNPDLIVDRGDDREYCAGSVAMIFEKLGGKVIYFGKPHPEVYKQSIKINNKKIIAIGDNLRTDIKGAISLNYDSLFITNGIHKNEVKNDGIESVLKKYNVTSTYYQSKLKW